MGRRGRGRARGRGRGRGRGKGKGTGSLYQSRQKQGGLRNTSKGITKVSSGKQMDDLRRMLGSRNAVDPMLPQSCEDERPVHYFHLKMKVLLYHFHLRSSLMTRIISSLNFEHT